MGILYDGKVSIAFDVHGCPQSCKHCYLGPQRRGTLTFAEALAAFESIRAEQRQHRYYDAEVEYFGPDFREPHFAGHYRSEYSAADRINGTRYDIDHKFELVSLWRLTRDDSYARWCKDRGIDRAQLKVFGGKEADDFFLGRRGAHEETLCAAEILLRHRIVPRFQIYLNRLGIASLGDFLHELQARNVLSRIRELGEEPNIHCMTFGSSGNGFTNHRYRIEVGDEELIPRELLEGSRAHFGKALRFLSEPEMASGILDANDGVLHPSRHWLWFLVDQRMDVFPNLISLHPKWRLGNLKTDPWEGILRTYVCDGNVGLKTIFRMSKHELVRRHLNPRSRKLYMSEDDLLEYYINREVQWAG